MSRRSDKPGEARRRRTGGPAAQSAAQQRLAVLGVGTRGATSSRSNNTSAPQRTGSNDPTAHIRNATQRRWVRPQQPPARAERAYSALSPFAARARPRSTLNAQYPASCDERPTSPSAQLPSGGGVIRCSHSVAVGCAPLQLTFSRWLMCRSPATPGAGISTALHKLHLSLPAVASRAQRGAAATGPLGDASPCPSSHSMHPKKQHY